MFIVYIDGSRELHSLSHTQAAPINMFDEIWIIPDGPSGSVQKYQEIIHDVRIHVLMYDLCGRFSRPCFHCCKF